MSHTMLLDTVQINLLSYLCSIGTLLFVKTIGIFILANRRAKGQFLSRVYFNDVCIHVLQFHTQFELRLLSKKHPKFCFCTILSNNFLQKALLMRPYTENVLHKPAEYLIDQIILPNYYTEKKQLKQTYEVQYKPSLLCYVVKSLTVDGNLCSIIDQSNRNGCIV